MRRIRVRNVSSQRLGKWAGMNPAAGAKLRFRDNKGRRCPERVILIDKDMPSGKRRKTVVHERVEYRLMKRGMSYEKAHRLANRAEKRVR